MAQLNILVVDDASFIRDLIKRTLRQQLPGATQEEAINGKKAVALIGKHHFDLILCDWEMPEMSGIEVLEWTRRFEQENQRDKTPFIMVTSRGDREFVVEAVGQGVSDYIAKPFTSDQLMRKVIKALARKNKAAVQAALAGSPKSSNDAFKDSANNLLSAGEQAKQRNLQKTEIREVSLGASVMAKPTQSAVAAKPKKARLKREVRANLRTPNNNYEVLVEDINLQMAVLRLPTPPSLDFSLFSTVVLDLLVDPKSDRSARLNGYIMSMAASERSLNPESISTTFVFADEDPEKLGEISAFITRVR